MLSEIMKKLNEIEIPEQYKSVSAKHAEKTLEDLLFNESQETEEIYDQVWSLLLNDQEKFAKFKIAYEKDKQAILKNYVKVFKK